MFDWRKLLFRDKKRAEVGSRSELDSGPMAAAKSEQQAMRAPAAPAAPAVAFAAAEPCPEGFEFPPGWLSVNELKLIQNITNEKTLIHKIRDLIPEATDEDALFRMTLSEAIYLGNYSIPILPVTALSILNLGRKRDVSLNDYSRLIEPDPGLTKFVLRRANSASYAVSIKCNSLEQALTIIGMAELERIIMMHALQNTVFRIRGFDDLVNSISRHGLAAAIATQHLCEWIGVNSSDGFLAGLFHDSGKLVLLNIIGIAQRKLRRKAPTTFPQFAFNAFHLLVGENACRKWELPPAIIQAVGNHHRRSAAGEALDIAVYHGNLLAHACESEAREGALPIENAVVNAATLDREKLLSIAEQTRAELADYAQFMSWS